ncbi:hypothetical protein JTB14_032712 [Gonioctena quinquepunctata]|nr:hypothetical protein JTB14_032712 [Gonioctena quinquepunctata]
MDPNHPHERSIDDGRGLQHDASLKEGERIVESDSKPYCIFPYDVNLICKYDVVGIVQNTTTVQPFYMSL